MHGTTRMYKRFFFFFIILLCAVSLFAGGGNESVAEVDSHNNEWTLSITDLDVSTLPVSRQILGGVILRTLVESLKGVEYRIRSNLEIQYYRDLAWSRSTNDAARALMAKQNERDLLVFRGDPSWRYRRTLRTYEADIDSLEARLRDAQRSVPTVSGKPKVIISNPISPWPAPPPEGDEYKFCVNQRADAFLRGEFTEFYGRIYVSLKLYTIYTNSYSWEDEILFASEDLDNALSELGARFNTAVSGLEPAMLVVHVEPEDAMIIIDNYWAGRGETPLREYVPGTVEVSAYAENHVPEYVPLEISSGEVAELFINLTPLGLSVFTIDVPGSPDSSVYLGSLFLGKTPLSAELSADSLSYISVETPSGETGYAVYGGVGNIRGSAEFVRSANTLAFDTTIPISSEEKRVATARNNFYSAWGRFWVAMPLSAMAIGLADSYANAYNSSQYPSTEMYNTASTWNYVKIGAFVLIGLVAIDTIYHIVRYLGSSGTDANPVAYTAQDIEYSEMEYTQ
jgi:hypothetical protein